MEKRKHGWVLFAHMPDGTCYYRCVPCGTVRMSFNTSHTYLCRDGQWQSKCPPCEPVEVWVD